MLTYKDKILLDYILKEYLGTENQYEIQDKRILIRQRKISGNLILSISKVIKYDFDVKSQIPDSPTYKKGFYTVVMFLL